MLRFRNVSLHCLKPISYMGSGELMADGEWDLVGDGKREMANVEWELIRCDPDGELDLVEDRIVNRC